MSSHNSSFGGPVEVSVLFNGGCCPRGLRLQIQLPNHASGASGQTVQTTLSQRKKKEFIAIFDLQFESRQFDSLELLIELNSIAYLLREISVFLH